MKKLIENKFSVVESMSDENSEDIGCITVPYIQFTIGTLHNGKFYISSELRKYLEWRYVMNWHKKYYKYINTWIENVLPYQCDYFVGEMFHLKDQGVYND